MILALSIFGVIAALVTFIVALVALLDEYIFAATGLFVLSIGLTILTVFGFRSWDESYQRDQCRAYAGINTEMQVEFQELSYWNYGCYARVDGKWILTDNIRVVVSD